jgi:predicted nucleic acid-binding protein
MATYHCDSSALAKGYVKETGSDWVEQICCATSGHVICLPQIGIAEVVSAFARLHRQGVVTEAERDARIGKFLFDCQSRYLTMQVNARSLDLAVRLLRTYPLKGYDAVQLSVALQTNQWLTVLGDPPLIFVSADNALLTAAAAEGLATENPNNH